MKLKNRIGEKHFTNEGLEIVITEYFGKDNVTIMYSDGFILKNIQYNRLISGKVKNYNFPSVKKIGYLGYGKFNPKDNKDSYFHWYAMITRCYCENYQKTRPRYKGCSVDERWHNFQIFTEWFNKNHVEDWQLDKDILVKGNKVYGPETCCFIPSIINSLFVKSNSIRGNYPIGVLKKGRRYRTSLKINQKVIHIGYFSTQTEAFFAYKKAKEKRIKDVAEQ